MTYPISGHRRRTTLSVSSPVDNNDPVEQLDHVVDILNQVNRVLPMTTPGRAELTAIGGLLAQISDALLTFTDLLSAPAQRYDRTRAGRPEANTASAEQPQAATRLLRDCQDGYLAARTSARAFHADLKRGALTRAHRSDSHQSKRTSDEPEPP